MKDDIKWPKRGHYEYYPNSSPNLPITPITPSVDGSAIAEVTSTTQPEETHYHEYYILDLETKMLDVEILDTTFPEKWVKITHISSKDSVYFKVTRTYYESGEIERKYNTLTDLIHCEKARARLK